MNGFHLGTIITTRMKKSEQQREKMPKTKNKIGWNFHCGLDSGQIVNAIRKFSKYPNLYFARRFHYVKWKHSKLIWYFFKKKLFYWLDMHRQVIQLLSIKKRRKKNWDINEWFKFYQFMCCNCILCCFLVHCTI